MLFAIPLGYFVAIILLLSGIYSGVDFLLNSYGSLEAPELLKGLVINGWPLIAASALLLLIQLNQQLEKLRLVAQYSPGTTPAGKKMKKQVTTRQETAPATPAPAATSANLSGLVAPEPQAAAALQPQPTTTPRYPNSPIPGGGRVPQTQTIPTPATHQPVPSTPSAGKRAPSKSEATGLSYFKVD